MARAAVAQLAQRGATVLLRVNSEPQQWALDLQGMPLASLAAVMLPKVETLAQLDNFAQALTALAVDNWSEFGGPQAAFYFHLGRADLARARVSVLNSDFRSVAWSHIGRYNVYLFDGPHAMQDQYDGLALAAPALEDSFVFIVDDWNWAEVREGTRAAITATGMNSEYEIEVLTSDDNVHPGEKGFATNETSDWHNGYFISVLTKGK